MIVSPRYVGKKPVDLFLLGEAPGKEEAVQGTAFVGESGRRMDHVLQIEVPSWSACFDNVYPDIDRVNQRPNQKDRLRFAERLEQRIKQENPRVIVALGETALLGLGIKAKPLKSLGSIFAWNGIPVVASVHPSYCLRTGGNFRPFERVFASVRLAVSQSSKERITRIDSPREWARWLKRKHKKLCAMDLETIGLSPCKGGVLCASASDGVETVWTPLAHTENHQSAGEWIEKLQALCEFWGNGPRITHSMFELRWMKACGAQPPTELYDTLLQATLLNENEARGLDALAVRYLKAEPWWVRMPQGVPFSSIPLDILGPYNAIDSLMTFRLHRYQRRVMDARSKQLADQMLTPLAKLLVEMESRGFYCDPKRYKAAVKFLDTEAEKRLRKIEKAFGINPRSAPQVMKLCYETLKLPKQFKVEKGKRRVTADEKALNILSRIEPKLEPLAECRRIQSLASNMRSWESSTDEQDTLHTEYTLGFAVTWRLSSRDPNMQNLRRPDASEPWLEQQRLPLVSRYRGGKIIQADYSQHELRVYAAVAGDEKFLQAFAQGIDIHTQTSEELGCERSRAKNVNFSIIYRITPGGLEEKYGIPKKEGELLLRRWREEHPWLERFYGETEHELKRWGWVESIFGFRRRLLNPDDPHEFRQGCNFKIQNPAVVFSYLAMLELQSPYLIHQIHDSIVLDVPGKLVSREEKRVKRVMENVDYQRFLKKKLHIPIRADVKVGEHL